YLIFHNPSSAIAGADSPDANVHGYAWSDTIGWISMNCNEGSSSASSDCGASMYGVNVDPQTGQFSGHAWSDNVGWISFNSADVSGCPYGTCTGTIDLGNE